MVRIAGMRISGTRAPGSDPRVAPAGEQDSLGDLVALAAKDVSQLVRYELDLAKSELKADAKRAGIAGALFGFAAFIGCLVLVLLTFALAYGLNTAGIPGDGLGWLWLDFIIAAAMLIVFAGVLVAVAILGLRRFSKMQQTRKTVTEDLVMLRRRDPGGKAASLPGAPGDKAAAVTDGR
ncbi:MAG TPA: phage holin family protein [Trebonia sp.]|jgi:uncharacterized integral membrane protein|nr:phage holin family protein [Trebonia sp.]